jgi:hypothetical protein
MAKADKPTKDKHKAAIIEWLSEGKSLRAYCREAKLGASTVIDWTVEDQQFGEQYARAREAGAELIFDDLDEVSEQAATAENAVEVAGLRLKADNIKWKLARMAPKRFGDKQSVDVNGKLDVTLFDPEQAMEMAKLAYESKSR